MTVSAFVVSPTAYPILDGVLAMSLVVHSHIGVSIFHSIESINASETFRCSKFDSMVVDYLHSRKFPKLGPIVTWGLRLATTGVLVGVYQFNTEDVGM